jgi:hypothetical protein
MVVGWFKLASLYVTRSIQAKLSERFTWINFFNVKNYLIIFNVVFNKSI